MWMFLTVEYAGVATLDGTYLASGIRGYANLHEACPNLGFGPCPWFANGTKTLYHCINR